MRSHQHRSTHIQRAQQFEQNSSEISPEEIQRNRERAQRGINKYIAKYKDHMAQQAAISQPGDDPDSHPDEKEADEVARKVSEGDGKDVDVSSAAGKGIQRQEDDDHLNKSQEIEQLPSMPASSLLGVRHEVESITIYNVAGEVVKTYTPDETKDYTIKLDKEVSDGVYIIKMVFKNGHTAARKLIKMSAFGKEHTIKLTLLPKVSSYAFRNNNGGSFSTDNAAPYIVNGQGPSALGVNGAPARGFHNVCEIRFNLDMNDRELTDFNIDVKRNRHNTAQYFVPAAGTNPAEWKTDLRGATTGKVDDDAGDNNDEHLVADAQNPHIYVFDGPGVSMGTIGEIEGWGGTEFVYAANFEEWVRFTELSSGNEFDDTTIVYWCCRIHFKKVSQGRWAVQPATTYIREGATELSH
jgi:hypothetical protein